jgi:hypothetical protein
MVSDAPASSKRSGKSVGLTFSRPGRDRNLWPKCLMQPALIIKEEPSYFRLRHSRHDENIANQRPPQSILIGTPAVSNLSVTAHW